MAPWVPYSLLVSKLLLARGLGFTCGSLISLRCRSRRRRRNARVPQQCLKLLECRIGEQQIGNVGREGMILQRPQEVGPLVHSADGLRCVVARHAARENAVLLKRLQRCIRKRRSRSGPRERVRRRTTHRGGADWRTK